MLQRRIIRLGIVENLVQEPEVYFIWRHQVQSRSQGMIFIDGLVQEPEDEFVIHSAAAPFENFFERGALRF